MGALSRRLLLVYAQLFFSRSAWVGGLLVAATGLEPRAALGGLAGALTGVATARALGLSSEESWQGAYGVNALLVGLGVAHACAPSASAAGLVLLGAGTAALATAALKSLLAGVGALPVLSSPFLLVYPLVSSLARALPQAQGAAPTLLGPAWPLEALGSVLFAPRWEVGALVLLALLVHSRIATLFSLVTLGVAALGLWAWPAQVDAVAWRAAGLNAALVALALSSVWFVPSAASLGLAMGGGALALLFTLGLWSHGVPALITPFYGAVVVLLLATRQRAANERPTAVDFVPGTPEENLHHFLTRRARFSTLHPVAVHLPFRGAWTCTQGVDGPHTHQGAWRHGFDFEVLGDDGAPAQGSGAHVEAHHCYRLPVLAAAAGTVVQVRDGVPDNAVGAVELEHNWGNLVLLQHAPALYSLVAHLAPGSVKVVVGQVVRQGDVVGLCGSSGRSPRPHLHFQLQAGPQVGGPTVPCRFAEVVQVADSGQVLWREHTCAQGQTVRPVAPEDDVARALALPLGVPLVAVVDGREETLTPEVDLYGRWLLRSSRGGLLYFRRTERGFVAEDDVGPEDSVVRLLRVALARVPFEAGAGLVWRDLVPTRWRGSLVARTLADFIAPFVPPAGLELEYHADRDAGGVVVLGRCVEGERWLTTRVELSAVRGLVSVEVIRRGVRSRAVFGAQQPIEKSPEVRLVRPAVRSSSFERGEDTWSQQA